MFQKENAQISSQRSPITIDVNCIRVRSFNATDQFRADVLLSIHIVGIVAISWQTIILLLCLCICHVYHIANKSNDQTKCIGISSNVFSVSVNDRVVCLLPKWHQHPDYCYYCARVAHVSVGAEETTTNTDEHNISNIRMLMHLPQKPMCSGASTHSVFTEYAEPEPWLRPFFSLPAHCSFEF